jgi:hypothetical protein
MTTTRGRSTKPPPRRLWIVWLGGERLTPDRVCLNHKSALAAAGSFADYDVAAHVVGPYVLAERVRER